MLSVLFLGTLGMAEWRSTDTVFFLCVPFVGTCDKFMKWFLWFWLSTTTSVLIAASCRVFGRLLSVHCLCSHLGSLFAFLVSLTKSLELSCYIVFFHFASFLVYDEHNSFYLAVERKNGANTVVRDTESPWHSIIVFKSNWIVIWSRREIMSCQSAVRPWTWHLMARPVCTSANANNIKVNINRLPINWIYASSVAIYVAGRQCFVLWWFFGFWST